MKRRSLLIGTAAAGAAALGTTALGGCSVLPSQPYQERRDWPLVVRRPTARPPARRGRVLLVRGLEAAPGMEARGVQWLEPDGSLHVDYWEQWAVPPAQAVEDDLRHWLAASGLFAAVIGPGSRLDADLVLEGGLTALRGDPGAHEARASAALVLLDQRPAKLKVLMQQTVVGTAPLAGAAPAAVVAALQAAVAKLLGAAEAAVARAIAP